eukprot:3828156-Rhodomonas_salina.6
MSASHFARRGFSTPGQEGRRVHEKQEGDPEHFPQSGQGRVPSPPPNYRTVHSLRNIWSRTTHALVEYRYLAPASCASTEKCPMSIHTCAAKCAALTWHTTGPGPG